MNLSPLFDLTFALNLVLPIVGIASVIMITISLIRIANAQRLIASSLERIEESLDKDKS